MSCTSTQIINQAKSWIGCKESNGSHKKIIDVYNSQKSLARGYKAKYTDSWCAIFVSACAVKCGATDIIPTECSCGNMIELMKKKGIWIEDDNITPKAGDIIMYDWDKKDGWPEHVGIVEKVSGKTITVIEGNKSDAVGRRTITVGNASIRGYGRPKYKASTSSSSSSSSSKNKIDVDGWWGPKTTKLAQKVFGTEQDGKVSHQFKAYKSQNPGLQSDTFEWVTDPGKSYSPLIKAIQKWCGATQDGHIGPNTIKKMQKKLGTPVDGVCSGPSDVVKAFQKYLNSKQ
ncbi:CHAP domain-containing protein [Allocoprobacillus halotolerans]|uniref:CHAP domain-containing protein n=1 Tax=Allocoprobacillus halotolerans TaxID=2944914 RepID=A0ABY5I216_9FIRM|nr:CHAP domain-containing protein [Allocoprobacillus halotolerans]UTY39369.1 CHAP domain-containing protein [Allocoprobacillus halotolerans]